MKYPKLTILVVGNWFIFLLSVLFFSTIIHLAFLSALILTIFALFWVYEKSGRKYVTLRYHERRVQVLISHALSSGDVLALVYSSFHELDGKEILGFSESETDHDSGLLFPLSHFSRFSIDSFTGIIYDVILTEEECKRIIN